MARNKTDIAARSTVRFVVLHHVEATGDHYDLMIEMGNQLATWKLHDPPEHIESEPYGVDRLPDHRPLYLDYEGPISGDRGHVTRHDSGVCVVHKHTDTRWAVTFCGQHLKGDYILECLDQSGARWRLRRPEI
ncbi:MAG: DNA polymerase ligase N-terminal domain-containing protein [Phycisphaerae bacterium]